MLEIFFLVRRVDAKEEIVVGDLVDQDVIDEAAVFVEQTGVVRLAVFEFGGVVGGDEIDQFGGLGTLDLDLTHVADVKQSDGIADGVVLINDAGILHRHIPAAEIDHFGAESPMDGVEGRLPEDGFRHEESG